MSGQGNRVAAMAGLCHLHGVAILYAFGSRAREVRDWLDGDGTAALSGASDVDIGVRPIPGVGWGVDDKVRRAGDLIPLERERLDLIMRAKS